MVSSRPLGCGRPALACGVAHLTTGKRPAGAVRGIAWTLLTQGGIVSLSVVVGFVLPALMGATGYGYWQVYVLYGAYVGLLGFGFSDGIILHYAGRSFRELPFDRLNSAVAVYCLQLALVCGAGYGLTLLIPDEDFRFIAQMLLISALIICLQLVVTASFLAVNDVLFYNRISFLTRLLTAAAYVGSILYFGADFRNVIVADLCARFVVLVISAIVGRAILYGRPVSISEGWAELREKSAAGLHLTLAAVASSLVLAVGRLVVQYHEDIATFGRYSFSVALIATITAFTAVAGTVLFPWLKSLESHIMMKYYPRLMDTVASLTLVGLLAYYPSYLVVSAYMHEFASVLEYLPVLFCVAVPLGRVQVVVGAFYKALRLERRYFAANLVVLAVMWIATEMAFRGTREVMSVAAVCLITTYAWAAWLTEYLRRKHDLRSSRRWYAVDTVVIVAFIVTNLLWGPIVSGGLAALAGLCVAWLCRRRLAGLFRLVRRNDP